LLGTLPWAPAPGVAELTTLRGRLERFVPDEARWAPLVSGAEIAAGTRLRTSPDGGGAFEVAGGIIVRAREATEWVFDEPTRVTLAGGSLYVDTGGMPSAGAALEIATPHGIVRHVGTQYEVRALSAELRVRVREGRVQINAHGEPPYETQAGEELLVAADGAIERRSIATDSTEWRWVEALAIPLGLDGGSALEALRWVARETGKRLIFEDANAELIARNAIIHGDSAGLEPLQVLEVVMATSASLDYVLGDGTLVVRRR
jgi:hypothetical protein